MPEGSAGPSMGRPEPLTRVSSGPKCAQPTRDTGALFILYAIPIGLLAGFALGGRLDRLAAVRFRLAPLAGIALAVQLVVFSALADGVPQELVRAAYIASTIAVVIVVLANVRLTGVPLIVL